MFSLSGYVIFRERRLVEVSFISRPLRYQQSVLVIQALPVVLSKVNPFMHEFLLLKEKKQLLLF